MNKGWIKLYHSKSLMEMNKKELRVLQLGLKDRLFEIRVRDQRRRTKNYLYKDEPEKLGIDETEGLAILAKVEALLEARDDFERMVIECLF